LSSGPVRVYLGIGSNIDPATHIAKALLALETEFGEIFSSSLYQTKSLGFEGPDFINLVVSFSTKFDFPQLDECLKNIEVDCGRDRSLEKGKGSRTLDLDLLLFGALEGEFFGCVLPRPEIYERQFVWQPLLEIFEANRNLSSYELGMKNQLGKLAKTASLMPPMGWPK
jgi:2-amino-4-hydroxy-6-hydroxymethyldihydropteridine diphosphokinase